MPRVKVDTLVVILEASRRYLRPIVLLLSIGEGCRTDFEFPSTLRKFFNAFSELFQVWFKTLAEFAVLVDFICFFPLKSLEFFEVWPSHDIYGLTDLVMDQHG